MDSRRATVRDLRRHNRSVVLSRLFFDGPLSRFELSHLTGRSAATISNVAAELLEERLIVEAGRVESDGRPRVLLRVNPTYGYVIGADVGETRVKIELFDLSMHRLATVEHPLSADGPDPVAVAGQVAAGLREVVQQAGVDETRVIGAGIGLTGVVEYGPTALVHAQTIGWEAVPIEKLLRYCGTTLALFFENGAKTEGQAEMWFGAGRGARHAVIALVGSGVGAAVITGGRAYRGHNSSAGEWGHTIVAYGGRACRCGARGCLEAYVGAGGILDRYHQARAKRRPADSDHPRGARRTPRRRATVGRRRPGPGRDRRLPRGRDGQSDQYVQSGAHRVGRLGRALCSGRPCCRASARPPACTPCAIRTGRPPSSSVSSTGTRSPSAPPRCRSPPCWPPAGRRSARPGTGPSPGVP